MKTPLLCIICLIHLTGGYGQKPPIDSSVLGKWQTVGSDLISNDGRFLLYLIDNEPLGNSTMVIKSLSSDWQMQLPGPKQFAITADSKRAIFINSNDSLCFITLGISSVNYVSKATSFKLAHNNNFEWLAYCRDQVQNQVVLENLSTECSRSYLRVKDYLFSGNAEALLLRYEQEDEGRDSQSLAWVNLQDSTMKIIWNGSCLTNIVFSDDNSQLAFIGNGGSNHENKNNIWYYKAGTPKAIRLASEPPISIENELTISNIQCFSKDGTRIFFNLMEKDREPSKSDGISLDIWSTSDEKLQSQQLLEIGPRKFAAVINIENRRIIQLQQKNEALDIESMFGRNDELKDDYVVVYHNDGDVGAGEQNWNKASRSTIFLVSTSSSKHFKIKEADLGIWLNGAVLSPENKYVVYYDPKLRCYLSYNITSNTTRNITHNINTDWSIYDNDFPYGRNSNYPVAGWFSGDSAVLLYDQNDIWKVDPSGFTAPICLTNGYGRKHGICFRIAFTYPSNIVPDRKRLILSAFNYTTKDNGFYCIGSKGEPKMLSMEPYVYGEPEFICKSSTPSNNTEGGYIVQRENASESRNYFYTLDFKNFTPLSTLHPENQFNWLKAQLITWRTMDRSLSQGILYKPENFDPHKKYPIIFTYYDKLSVGLNLFHAPGLSEGAINIPYFVSNGYLVFTPDIHYKIGHPGESIVNCVVSAANYLSSMPWINKAKMGINGHSFGGYETDYLLTHSNIFAAACSSSGVCDLVSFYGSLWGNGGSQEEYMELRRMRIGATLWQAPNLYLKNSPIFYIDKVTTPLLMLNNKGDDGTPFSQGVELFTGLRRLGKKAWMLQYDGSAHGVVGKAAEDYTIRLKQFFDHYLKDLPMPRWMGQGIDAQKKGFETGLESY